MAQGRCSYWRFSRSITNTSPTCRTLLRVSSSLLALGLDKSSLGMTHRLGTMTTYILKCDILRIGLLTHWYSCQTQLYKKLSRAPTLFQLDRDTRKDPTSSLRFFYKSPPGREPIWNRWTKWNNQPILIRGGIPIGPRA